MRTVLYFKTHLGLQKILYINTHQRIYKRSTEILFGLFKFTAAETWIWYNNLTLKSWISESFREGKLVCFFFFKVYHSHLETNYVYPLRKWLKIFIVLLKNLEDLGVLKDENSSHTHKKKALKKEAEKRKMVFVQVVSFERLPTGDTEQQGTGRCDWQTSQALPGSATDPSKSLGIVSY